MEKVILSKAARAAFGQRLGRSVPSPDSEEFDELLEELREMQPDVYTDLVNALEHKGELLPVKKEAMRAQRRAQRQQVADYLKNRKTHDGRRVPDKRKSLVLGGVLAACLMAWMGYTNVSRAFTARAATGTGEVVASESAETEVEAPFGILIESPDLGEELEVPATVQAQAPAPPQSAPAPAPPQSPPPAPADEPPTEPSRARSSLPFGMDRPLERPRDEQEDEAESGLPPAPGPPQPGVAGAPPANPYSPPTGSTTPGGDPAPAPLPTNLSFVPLEAPPEGPLNVLSTGEGAGNTGMPSAPGSALAAPSTSAPDAPPPASLSSGELNAEAAPTSVLGWEEQAEETVEERSLSFTLSQQGGLSEEAANLEPLPPVPEVGGGAPPPPTPQADAQPPPAEPEVVDLSALLTPGTPLEAELLTGVAATDGTTVPVLARTTGSWCGEDGCPEITWIGEASYPGADRVEMNFSQAVVENTVQGTSATAFDSDHLPGVRAGVRDAAPTAVQDLLRGAVGGASDYLNALNSRETVVIQEGRIVRERAEPDLGNYLLGRGAELFALPGDQTSMVRLAEVAPGTPFTVMYGLR